MIEAKDRNGKKLRVGDKVRVVQHKNGPRVWSMWGAKELELYPIGQKAKILDLHNHDWDEYTTISIQRPDDLYGAHFILPECVERIDHE